MLPEWPVKFGEWVSEKYTLVKGRFTGRGEDAENDLSGAAEAGDEVVAMSDLGRGVRKTKLLTAAGVEPYGEGAALDGGNGAGGKTGRAAGGGSRGAAWETAIEEERADREAAENSNRR